MNKPASSPVLPRYHFAQAAQRLGISVQRLMSLERSGAVLPPASLARGEGRHYTQAEVDAIADALSRLSTDRGGGSRAWWLVLAAALALAVWIGLRPAARVEPMLEEPAAAPVETQRFPQPIRPEAEEPEDSPEREPAVLIHPEQPTPPPREGDDSEERLKQLHDQGLFY